MELKAKLHYLWTCLRHMGNARRCLCPSCGSSESMLVARKYAVTALRRCRKCQLLYRTPTTTADENQSFYQSRYRQGFTTDVPDPEELEQLVKADFAGSPKDYSAYIGLLQALNVPKGARILDFGCSWGYGTWQLQKAGYEVVGYEISQARSRYAREHLGMEVYFDWASVPHGPYDVFFSAHVLEHVPSVSGVIALAKEMLSPEGIWLAVTPNGSTAYREAHPEIWNQLWGLVHPNFLDDRYYLTAFEQPLLASSPYDFSKISSAWNLNQTGPSGLLDGEELMVAVRRRDMKNALITGDTIIPN